MLYLIETKPITYIRLTCKHVPKHNTQLANLRNNYDSWKNQFEEDTIASPITHFLIQWKWFFSKKNKFKNHALFNRNQTNNLYPFDMQARPKT